MGNWPLSETAVCLECVSVVYQAPNERVSSFKEHVIRSLQKRTRYDSYYALKDIYLEVPPGEIFGIIGRNGAGKSTLLKVISRVIVPTSGRVITRGKISPLLQLGAGFHPELTGWENIFLNGTLLGHSRREIQASMKKIREFAELGDFIHSPLRTYSSGMIARLGFSVATNWQPEILILDEVMSVGDEAFRRKCEERMKEFSTKGTTILLVAHNLQTIIKLCSKAAWLDRGRLRESGDAREVIAKYQNSIPT